MSKKIGIITWHYYINYGSGLQAFALQETLSRLGYDVSIINYRKFESQKSVWWKSIIKTLLRYTAAHFSKRIYNSCVNNTRRYQKKYLKETAPFRNPKEISTIGKDYFCLVYGSDQIWAPNVYTPFYLGAYVPKETRKISYAASIGLNDIPDDLVDKYTEHLSSYSSIAVRETEGQELLNKRCGIKSEVVLDPTLMVDANTYRSMQKPVKGIKGRYVFCYFLNKEHKYREKVEEYAKKHNLQIIGCSDKQADAEWFNRLTNIGADQFLWLINNAETIFTDSYHGSIFSLLFHKNLWTFIRFNENNPICQNSRIRQLQEYFNLGHRIISHQQEIDDSKTIDYIFFENELAKLRSKSLEYIKDALK